MGIYEDTLSCGCTSGTYTLTYPPENYITPRPGCLKHNGPGAETESADPAPTPPSSPGSYDARAAPIEPRAWLDEDRPFLRISLKTRDGAFRTVTFACYTGAPDDVYLDPFAWAATADCRPRDATSARGTAARVLLCQQSTHNYIGLRLLASFGMRLDESGVVFDRLPPFIAWTPAPPTPLTYGEIDDAAYAELDRRIRDRVEDAPTPAEWAVVANHLASLSATVQEIIEETAHLLARGKPEQEAAIRERVVWAANDLVGGWANGRPFAP